jgi:hypothetical protein
MNYKIYLDPETEKACAVFKSDDNGQIWCIPFAPDNTDYANFKKDLADGAELQDAEGNVIDGIAYLEELV